MAAEFKVDDKLSGVGEGIEDVEVYVRRIVSTRSGSPSMLAALRNIQRTKVGGLGGG